MATPGTCRACEKPLVVLVEDDSDDEMDIDEQAGPSSSAQQSQDSIPDDLELPCGCHFHWQCILDQSPHVAINLTCPSCETPITTNPPAQHSGAGPSLPSVTNPIFRTSQSGPAILSRYTTESGTETDYDILPTLTEEAYLDSHPDERRARAFLVMCGQGDVLGIVELLKDADAESDGQNRNAPSGAAAVAMYRDPLNRGKSGLQLAIEKGQEEVVWSLLYVAAPKVPIDVFPQIAVDTASSMGVARENMGGGSGILSLKDDDGRSAEDYAREAGGPWQRLIHAGVLHG